MAKEGSTISGLMDAFATQTSVALQYGVPLEVMVRKFSHMRFEPGGYTSNPEIPIAKSIIDYIFRWLGSRFLDAAAQDALGIVRTTPSPTALPFSGNADAPSCADCGAITVRSGTCYRCLNCGTTTGCG